jgi:predicted phosphodiesterase
MSLRVQLLSDFHVEFHRDRGQEFIKNLDPTDVDVLVVAGDAGTSMVIGTALKRLCERYAGVPVLFVAGNHEYYQDDPDGAEGEVREVAETHSNLQILDNRTVEVRGVRFAGTTLWFRDDPMNAAYQRNLADFEYIGGFVPWVYEENRVAEGFLRGMMAFARPPEVVITHHLPSERCVSPKYKGSTLNRFFVCPIADELPVLPKMWMYGHTHDPADFEHRGCRFLCNAFGYPHEPKRRYKEKLIVEIEPWVQPDPTKA